MVVNDTAKRLAGEDYDALIIGGAFDSTCRTCQAQYCSVGAWEGHSLHQVGSGLCARSLAPSMTVKTMLLNELGDLFAGGTFHSRVWDGDEFISVFNVAHFYADRQLWTPLRGGQLVCNWAAASVLSLAWDPKEQKLYLGGKFNYIDTQWIPAGLAVWSEDTGLQGFPGGGLSMGNTTFDGVATALTLDPDAGLLIVAGNYNRVGDVLCDSIASWHLRRKYWTCLYEVEHSFDVVTSLLFSSGTLHVAGHASWRSSWTGGTPPRHAVNFTKPGVGDGGDLSALENDGAVASPAPTGAPTGVAAAGNPYTIARFRLLTEDDLDPASSSTGHNSGGKRGGKGDGSSSSKSSSSSSSSSSPKSGKGASHSGTGTGTGSGGGGGHETSRGLKGDETPAAQRRSLASDVWGGLSGRLRKRRAPWPMEHGHDDDDVDVDDPKGDVVDVEDDGSDGGSGKLHDWTRHYQWEWLPHFGGTNAPIRSMLAGEDEWQGALLLAGEFTTYPAVAAYWAKPVAVDDDGRHVHVVSVGGPGAVRGVVTSLVQMRIRPQSRTQYVNRDNSWRLVAIFASIGLALGIVIAVALNFSAAAQLFRNMGAGARGMSLAEMASLYSSYGKVDEGNMAEAYERAMQARHLWNKSNLPVLDPTEIVLEDVIGEGTFGRVWRGSWRHSAVAVKEFVFAQAAVVGGSKQRDELLQEIVGEAGIMAMLRHPKILHLYGCSLTMQAIWITSELCSRGNLRQVLNDEELELSEETKLKMCVDVAEGMVYLHARDPPLIHRDLKTHNLFIHEPYPGQFVVKIGDWGSARAQSSKSMRTMTHGVGTACWLAPEVIRYARGSKASDVYSFGIVLWEIATRNEVYPELSATQIIAKVANERLRPELPEECIWAELMQECWADEPEDRPTFEEVLAWLTRLLLVERGAKIEGEGTALIQRFKDVIGYGAAST
mmetsp:Transcript_26850/g.84145  ORF Transcript_26850/g.84145 Transcript_26850/m.84145 type:complete len:941 (-) Transcript_26850:90-2912(-)